MAFIPLITFSSKNKRVRSNMGGTSAMMEIDISTHDVRGKHSFANSPSRRSRISYDCSSSVPYLTASTSSLSSTIQSEDSSCQQGRRRRVRFIDQVQGGDIVTSTSVRPRTTPEEKSSLYYTSKEFRYFAYEGYCEQVEMLEKSKVQVFGWDNLYDYCDDKTSTITMHIDTEEDIQSGGSPLHKSKSLRDFHFDGSTI